MPRLEVEHRGITYTVSPDDPVPQAQRFQSIVRLRLVDELTGNGVSNGISLSTDEPGLKPHIGPGGLAGLVGVPQDALPQLNTTAYDLNYEIHSDRFIGMARRDSLPMQPGYPDTFDPLEVGDVQLHSTAVSIRGRVVEDDGHTRTPAPNAPVNITDIWRTLPPPSSITNEPPNMVAISPPLYAQRGSLLGTLRPRAMPPAGGPALRIVQRADAGQPSLKLLQSTGLNLNDVVEIEFPDPARPDHDPVKTEFLRIAAIHRVHDALPSTLLFDHDLAFSHDEGVSVRLVNPQPPGAIPQLFSRGTLPGERCIFLVGLAGVLNDAVVEITGDTDLDGNPLAPEYHRVSTFFSTTTDMDGYFRFPPISRVAQLAVEATIGLNTVSRIFNPDYTVYENRCDLIRPI